MPSPQLQRLRRRKEEDYPEEADYVWDTEDFSYATTDWNQDEWEHFAFFMNAIKDKHEATSAMNDMQETSTSATKDMLSLNEFIQQVKVPVPQRRGHKTVDARLRAYALPRGNSLRSSRRLGA